MTALLKKTCFCCSFALAAAGPPPVAAEGGRLQEGIATSQEASAPRGRCRIVLGGRTLDPESHAIVIPAQATPQEQHAAQDLQFHLKLITGQELPLLTDEQVQNAIPLIVGRSKLLEKMGVAIDFEALGLEGIALESRGPALVMAGNRRGVLYAVYTFLEDDLGCRWFTPDCATWPTEGEIRLDRISRRYVPPLEYRATDYPNSRDADWAVRNKINGTQTHLDEKRGGKVTYAYFVHTFNALIPPEKYFDLHPEWFSEINGVRVRDYSQLCLTNPEMLEEAKRRVREWIEANPDATIFSVSQNDWHNYCQCPNCTALAEEEGSQSGPLLHFVNAIAESVEKDYPHVLIDTLAYQYTRKPPRFVRPRPNVAVRLCSIECGFNRPLATDPFNRSFVEDLRGWHRICNRLHIWDYVIDYSHCVMPFPNLYVLKPNIQFFIENGVTGIYEEANYFSKGGEFAELRTYILAKTLWDPSYDTDRAIEEFLAAYYGPAAGPIREYIHLIHRAAQEDPDLNMVIWTPPTAKFLSPELIRRAVELFDQAEAAVAADPRLLHRVQVARLPILYVQIAQATSPAYREEGEALVGEAQTDVSQLAARFERIARAEGLTHIREGAPNLESWLQSLPQGAARLPLERLRNPALEVSVLPALGGRIWRLRTLPEGRDVLKVYGTPEALVPGEGGYEEYSQSGYRSPGWREPYQVVERTERSLRLELQLRNGLRLQRTLELDPEKPLLHITSTITNAGDTAQTAGLRVHPTFAVTSTQKATVKIRRGGGWETVDLAWPDDPLAERELWLREAQKPEGEWAVVDGEAGQTVVNRFDPEQVGLAYLNWSGKEQRVNLELWAPERKLAPGETMTLEHTYEVRPADAGR